MKLLIILGSPRKGGNSETVATKVADAFVAAGGGEVEYVRLNSLQIRPCQGCGGCEKKGICVLKDDMTELYQKVDEADRLILVSPVYFYGITAQCKLFGDRLQAHWARRYILKERFRADENRKGYLISTAATVGPKIFDCSVLMTRYIFDATDVEYGGELLIKGVDERKAVLGKAQELVDAEKFGREMASGTI